MGESEHYDPLGPRIHGSGIGGTFIYTYMDG